MSFRIFKKQFRSAQNVACGVTLTYKPSFSITTKCSLLHHQDTSIFLSARSSLNLGVQSGKHFVFFSPCFVSKSFETFREALGFSLWNFLIAISQNTHLSFLGSNSVVRFLKLCLENPADPRLEDKAIWLFKSSIHLRLD